MIGQRLRIFLNSRPMLGDFVKFGTVGVVGAIIDLGLLNFLYLRAGTSIYWATGWAFITATVVVYFINNSWTYRRLDLPFRAQNLLKYIVVGAIGLGLTEGIIHLLAVEGGLNYNVTKVIAIGLVFFWNFGANRAWTFRVAS